MSLIDKTNKIISQFNDKGLNTGGISDGYHTFDELYDMRMQYNAALFNEWAEGGKHNVHKSTCHYDGEECFGGGWFIVVAELPTGQISNHYEIKHWDLFNIPSFDKAQIPFDEHTTKDVLLRLDALNNSASCDNKVLVASFDTYFNSKYPVNDITFLNGKKLIKIEGLEKYSEEVIFHTDDGFAVKVYHEQDCCEDVNLVDFEGDAELFVGAEVLSAELVSSNHKSDDDKCESQTWTFYKIQTNRGELWMRWLGESNGYYSEEVNILIGRHVDEGE